MQLSLKSKIMQFGEVQLLLLNTNFIYKAQSSRFKSQIKLFEMQ